MGVKKKKRMEKDNKIESAKQEKENKMILL